VAAAGVDGPADERPWSGVVATGVGSLPGTDAEAALRTVLDELPDLPHLPELPERGPGADLVGRGAALLLDLHVDLQPAGWRLVDRPGRDERRARDLLERDLDVLAEVAARWSGPFKVQVAGPWTLAAALELTRGNRALADEGAVRDLGASLREGVAAHLMDVSRRLPGARLVVQVDEPALPAVLAGLLPTASGFGRLPAVPEPDATEALRRLVAAAHPAYPVVHCCANDAPVPLLRAAGFRGVSVDTATLTRATDDDLGAAVEADVTLLLGLVPTADPVLSDLTDTVAPVRSLWRRLGLSADALRERVAVTPACGLAGAGEAHALAALRRAREAARALDEVPEG